jgi:hypothetical protein
MGTWFSFALCGPNQLDHSLSEVYAEQVVRCSGPSYLDHYNIVKTIYFDKPSKMAHYNSGRIYKTIVS